MHVVATQGVGGRVATSYTPSLVGTPNHASHAWGPATCKPTNPTTIPLALALARPVRWLGPTVSSVQQAVGPLAPAERRRACRGGPGTVYDELDRK